MDRSAQGHITLRQPLHKGLPISQDRHSGAGLSQKAASLSLPPFQTREPLRSKLVGPIMQARVAL